MQGRARQKWRDGSGASACTDGASRACGRSHPGHLAASFSCACTTRGAAGRGRTPGERHQKPVRRRRLALLRLAGLAWVATIVADGAAWSARYTLRGCCCQAGSRCWDSSCAACWAAGDSIQHGPPSLSCAREQGDRLMQPPTDTTSLTAARCQGQEQGASPQPGRSRGCCGA